MKLLLCTPEGDNAMPHAPETARPAIADPASVDAAIESRFSARAFLPRPVPQAMLQDILRVASRAPSGTNTQPWKVYVLQGAARDAVVDKVCAAHDQLRDNPELEARYPEPYDYYPAKWVEPYLSRRRAVGLDMYGLLGIGKGEKDKMHAQQQRNFRFFDAPVGMFFTIDRIMGRGSLLDYGCFLQSVMLAARARGLHTCPQAAWNRFDSIIMPHIGAGENEMIVGALALALGWADEAAPVNALHTAREPVQSFVRFLS